MKRSSTVILDITERCNLKCVMCYFSGTDRLRFAPYDVELSSNGNMPVEVFEKVAADLFPKARRASLACAAEPLIHSRFRDIIEIAGRYQVPDLWFPTNLLALTEKTAEAIVDAKVGTVATSIDGFTQETYEKIRIGGKWDRLISRLELLGDVRKKKRSKTKLRLIFTWMKSNLHELEALPAFATKYGASEIDVRFVIPTAGVDVTPELLSGEDPAELRAVLKATAHEAVRRGIKLSSYPEFETAADRPRSRVARLRRRAFRIRAGLERLEHWRHLWRERRQGCAYPGETWVVRPNGAVYPCIFWTEEPLGFYPQGDVAEFQASTGLGRIQDGLAEGCPVGTCATCTERRDAFYRPLDRFLGHRAEVHPG
jgi:MoaA/NifB/PqqE/SkfB family radical SAM enzyme